MTSNLPPGVTDSMIPGNRPEDKEYDTFCEFLTGKMAELGIRITDEQFESLAEALWWKLVMEHQHGFTVEQMNELRDDAAEAFTDRLREETDK